LVFFFDEAHLLFKDASKAFLGQVEQTVKLIRSKGVGVFFCTQLPTDVPNAVLSQLGSRVQHALRAFTPDDQQALAKTVRTYPKTDVYDLATDLTALGIGEAIVTVLSERGAPTPVAWTKLRSPRSLMDTIGPDHIKPARCSSNTDRASTVSPPTRCWRPRWRHRRRFGPQRPSRWIYRRSCRPAWTCRPCRRRWRRPSPVCSRR
jgi:hypothetical protein